MGFGQGGEKTQQYTSEGIDGINNQGITAAQAATNGVKT